jgi:hypothetical protein
MSTNLGTLGFHLDGRPCRVGCSFCYLGVRSHPRDASLAPAVAATIAAIAPARDLAVAISEPASRWREGLEAVADAARERGVGMAVTTTPDVIRSDPWVVAACTRLTVSIDPEKRGVMGLGRKAPVPDVDVASLAAALDAVRRPGLEIVGLASLASEAFCDRLTGGLLADLVQLPQLDLVALNGLKPPPPWCDRAFWLRFLARIRPLLDRHLGRRLHLDCYVNARILGLSGCPAKPDVTAGHEFRACVYQRDPDFIFEDAADFARRTADYLAPATCPFPIV